MSLRSYCEENNRLHILREWDTEKNFPLTPDTVAHTSNIPVWWQCEQGHSWCTQIRSRSRSSTGCPKCREEKLEVKRQRHIEAAKLQYRDTGKFRCLNRKCRKRMKKTIEKVWNILTSILVSAAIVLAILLVGVRVIGLRPLQVLSGSMEPTYHVGSLIYVKSVDYTELKAGDVITFMLDEDTLATHRIVEVVPDEEDGTVIRYRTKGDANDAADGSLVHYKNVVGTPVFTIPYLGYVANYLQNPPGTYIAVSAGAILLLLVFLPDLLFGSEDEPPKKKRGNPEQPRDSQ